MGRTAMSTTVIDQLPVIGPNEAREMDAQLAQGATALTAETLLRNLLEGGGADALQAAGAIKATMHLRRVADCMIAQIYVKVKQTKCYLGLPYRNKEGEPATCRRLEDYCEAYLGKSYRRCQELERNLTLLGSELYESAEEIGFSARDYNALNALPADDQEAVRVALSGDDTGRSLQLLGDLIARQYAEKRQMQDGIRMLEGERDQARLDYDVVTKLLGESKTKVRKLENGDLKPLALDLAIAGWPGAAGFLIGEIRKNLTQIGLMIQSAEQFPFPEPETPEADVHQRAMRLLYDALSAPLNNLGLEVQGVAGHLERIVGALAYPEADGGYGVGRQGGEVLA